MFLYESEANVGHFSPRRHANMRKLWLSCQNKGKFQTLKGSGKAQNLLTGLRNHCFKRQNDGKLVVTEKNNEPMPQPEIDQNSGW